MSNIGHNFPPAEELPIPQDVRPGPGWTDRMLEMADHIGPYRTLLLVDRFGGMRIYIPADWTKGKSYGARGSIRDAIGDEGARILSDIYRRELFLVPTAKLALARARRAPVLAQVRSGDMSGVEAAQLLGTSRPYLSYLINETEEGMDGAERAHGRHAQRIPGQMDLFGEED